MSEKLVTCTTCPMGCLMTVCGDEHGVTAVRGNGCPRGKTYAENEFICPLRTLTSSVRVRGGTEPLASVRSDHPMPADRMQECVALLRETQLSAPVSIHQTVLENLWGLGVNIVTTMAVPTLQTNPST